MSIWCKKRGRNCMLVFRLSRGLSLSWLNSEGSLIKDDCYLIINHYLIHILQHQFNPGRIYKYQEKVILTPSPSPNSSKVSLILFLLLTLDL